MPSAPISSSVGSLAVSGGAQAVAIECSISSLTITPAAADSVLTVYDGTSTSGTLLCSITAKANAGTLVYPLNIPVKANKGVFYVLSGTAATATLHYVVG